MERNNGDIKINQNLKFYKKIFFCFFLRSLCHYTCRNNLIFKKIKNVNTIFIEQFDDYHLEQYLYCLKNNIFIYSCSMQILHLKMII